MNEEFYEIAKKIDDIKNLPTPSKKQVGYIFTLIQDDKYAKYFFSNLDNPFWIEPLFNNGFFTRTPEPEEVSPGSYEIKDWPIADYLAKFADFRQDITSEIISTTKTENWRIMDVFISAMVKLHPDISSKLVFCIDNWLDSRFSGMLPNSLIQLSNYFVKENHITSAIRIFEYVLKPTPLSSDYEESIFQSAFRFRSDSFWVNEYFKSVHLSLSNKSLERMISVYQNHIELAISLTSEKQIKYPEKMVGYYWRMDIPFRSSNRNDPNVLDLLVDGLRDTLLLLCKKSKRAGEKTIVDFIHSNHILLKRIAIHVLREYGNNYPKLVTEILSQFSLLESDEYKKEYRGLLRDQFGAIPTDLQKSIIDFILSGPSNIEEKAKNWALADNREPTKEDALLVIDRWRFQHLPLIEKYLSLEELAILTSIKEKYKQEPDIRERPSIEIGSVTTVQSPVSVDELTAMDFLTQKEYFLTYVPETKYMHSRDSLGRTFKSLVSNDGKKYYNFAPLLIDDNIRLVYTYYYLQGITEGIKTNAIRLTNDILQLCQYVVEKNDEPDDPRREPYEPGLEAAKNQVADLLVEVVKKSDYYLSRDQLDSIRAMLIELAHHPDPSYEEEKESSMDPFTYSLNCIRGRAMHGILDYSLYIVRQRAEQEGKERIPGFMEDPVTKLLNEKIDPTEEKSPAVHSVFGAYLTQLHFLSKEWVKSHLDQLFPAASEKDIYWRAAWDGYIFGSNVVNDIFKLILPQYQRGLKLLGQPKDEKDYWGGSPDERLAQHVMVIYLRELTDFDHENQILDLFFEHAPDQIRAQAIFWLGKVLENEKKERTLTEETVVWKRCWKLWQTRLKKAETDEITKNWQEISDYMRWLVSAPMSIDQLYETLLKSIKYFQDRFDVMQLLDYAVRYCEQSPSKAVNLLWKTISSAKEPWWRANEEVEGKILRAAMTSDDDKAREIAIKVINRRGEQGDYQWRELLEL